MPDAGVDSETGAAAGEAVPPPPATEPSEAADEAQSAPEPAPADAPADAASGLAAPSEPPPAPADEFSDLDDEAPPGQSSPRAIRVARETPPPPIAETPPAEERPERWWRYPRNGTQRPITLPQGAMYWRSTVSLAVVPAGTGGQFRGSTHVGYGVGVFDDFEIGTHPLGLVFVPPFNVADPSFYARARILSGEVQLGVRGEWTIPLSSNGGAWMGYSVDLAWTPIDWFRFETSIDYGLHFLTPLQQTIHIPLRARFQAGPNTFGVETGAVMYNDADDFDVPLILRWAVAWGGWQGPVTEAALEGGIADLTQAENAWFVRASLTFFAYP